MGAVFIIECQSCGKKLKRRAEMMELQGRCPHCQSVIPPRRKPETGPRRVVRPVTDAEREWDGSLLNVYTEGGVAVVTFATSHILDQSNVQALGDDLDALVDEHKHRYILIDFKGVTYMSSTVMGRLAGLLQKVQAAGGEVRLCGIEEEVKEIFDTLSYDKLFKMYRTRRAGLKAMKKLAR
jgi:anti-sigma B factor antagonist